MTANSDLLKTLQETAEKLIQALPEDKLKAVIAGLLSSEGIIPSRSQEFTPAPAATKTKNRGRRVSGSYAPVFKALEKIGRGTEEQILVAIQDVLHVPTPKDHEEAIRWVRRSLSKNSTMLRKWADGSWSKLAWQPELAVSAA